MQSCFALANGLGGGKASKSPPSKVLGAYVAFFVLASSVWHFVAAGEFSVILTMSVMFQCLAFALLGLQVMTKGNVVGISLRALCMEALAMLLRLSSTLWLNGYLPVDASGDWIFQATDLCSLALIGALLYQVVAVHKATYQEDEDTLPIAPMVVAAFVLAAIFHADMNDRPLFDTLWMAGLIVGALAVLPQLWLITRSGGKVEAFTSHFIAAMAMSRLLCGTFMWHAHDDVSCKPWVQGVNHAIWAIHATHVMNLLLLVDFAFYYIRAVVKNGLAAVIDFEEAAKCQV